MLSLNLSDPTLEVVRACGCPVVGSSLSHLLLRPAGAALLSADIVLFDVAQGGHDNIEAVRRLRSAICASGSACRILCYSTAHRNPRFIRELTKCGARYVRVGNPAMLVEAIELLLAEVAQIEQAGPCFCIWHRFSHGTCAPGEEIAAVELVRNGEFFQLHLALSGRFVFDYLAGNRPLALDAFQIASGLSGWFYREHALNGGMKQTTNGARCDGQSARAAHSSGDGKGVFKCRIDV